MDKASRKYYDKNSYSEEEKMNTEIRIIQKSQAE